MIIYQFRRGADGLPCLVRLDTIMVQACPHEPIGATPPEATLSQREAR